jgi:hypothetical protein
LFCGGGHVARIPRGIRKSNCANRGGCARDVRVTLIQPSTFVGAAPANAYTSMTSCAYRAPWSERHPRETSEIADPPWWGRAVPRIAHRTSN